MTDKASPLVRLCAKKKIFWLELCNMMEIRYEGFMPFSLFDTGQSTIGQ